MKKILLALTVLLAFPAAVNAQDYYTVQKGDSFWKVAKIFNLSIDELKSVNPSLENIQWIKIGEQLELPGQVEKDTPNGDLEGNEKEEAATPEQESDDQDKQQANQDRDQASNEQNVTQEEEAQEQESVSEEETNDTQETVTESEFEQEVIRLTNVEREQRGLEPLEAYSELSDVARDKSKDMRDNGYFSHDSPTYGSPFDMMDTYGIEYRGAGENIAAGQRTPEEVVQGWMDSQGHRENILNGSFTHIGVGHVEGGSYGHYWTQMFVTK
ncbi:CAP domain-containing protein [Alteribacillus iranensis]|uniref:Uncharacterized protein, YkwD family n=1 Tax=Alteribacillus iranensis TaxID=930128 RepID=A0A1I2DGU2_9BACI|nr:CAP domain-containing protein [Alteribacillus iranensis]SFE79140.1 uncharacterized protein, YkwD family [Alteribacillus iranensis]